MAIEKPDPGFDDDTVVPTGKTVRDEPDGEPKGDMTGPTTNTSPDAPNPEFDDDTVTPTGKTIRDTPDEE